MAKDFYQTLGVEKNASKADLKKAFYKLAQKYHPDKPDGDEAKFKEINQAYQTLSDDKKRAQYDRFGSAGPGAGFGGGAGGFGGFDFSNMDFSQFQQGGQGGMHFEFGDLGDIFNMFTGGGARMRRGRDLSMELRIKFSESIFGITKDIEVPGINGGQARKTTISIPAGIEHGQRLRVRGYGEVIPEGQAGDLFLVILVEKHQTFRREGPHLIMTLPVKLTDAILGAKYPIKLLDDKEVTVKIPKGLKSAQILRVKGKGVAGRGDLLIQTNTIIPDKLSKKSKKAVEALQGEGW